MELLYQGDRSGLQVLLIRGLGEERDAAEREILAAGVRLVLPHRKAWARDLCVGESWFLLLRDAQGNARAGVAIEKRKSRALPGHMILRIDKFGESLHQEMVKPFLEAIRILAEKTPRLLRLHLNVFSLTAKAAIGEMSAELGFREIIPPTSSRYTLVIDLKPSEEEVFERLGRSARKRIRETMKSSLQTRAITDPIYAERLKGLQLEAMKRTDGPSPVDDWKHILRFSRENPGESQVIGLFLSEDMTPANLAAFVWVCIHGDHAEYRLAGSTRITDSRKVLGYPLVWEMIRFAKANGSEWFDMGGVTLEEGGNPALKGISDFKRHFTKEVVEIGAEWVFEPSPVKAEIAKLVSTGVQRIRGLMRMRGQHP
jgi:hypothetical protein